MTDIQWHLEMVPIKSIQPHPRNPRQLSKHDHAHLKKSLDKFGLIDKPIVNTDGTMIGGHQRLKILKSEGLKEIEVWKPSRELTDREVDELNIRHNRATGEWDFDILGNQWNLEDLLDWGFQDKELSVDIETIESDEGEQDRPLLEPTKDPKTKLGDLYELGTHRLLCGDSTLPECVERLLDGITPVLMVTDPPYGVEYDASWRQNVGLGKGKRAAGKVQNDDKINWALAWSLFPGNVAYVWHAGKYCAEVQKSLQDAEFDIISQIIWAKQHFALSRGDYHWQHEPCWYAVRKGREHNWQGSRKESTLWEISNLNAFGKSADEDERTAHSTQKPLECMSRPIRNNTSWEDSVYDPFTGSGTTLIAAQKLDRRALCMELDPAYCDLIIDRYKKYCSNNGVPFELKRNGEAIDWEVQNS